MIQLQLISRGDVNLEMAIRNAISTGKIKSFETAQVVGGLKITHKKHPGLIRIEKSKRIELAMVSCTNPSKEWQLLEAFVGRIAYHFHKEVAAINIQFD